MQTKSSYNVPLVYFSVILITVLVFLSETLSEAKIIEIPPGFRHISVLSVFVINWFLFGHRLVMSKFYVITLFLMLLFLMVAFFSVPVAVFNYVLGICFTFLFVIIFITAANTRTSVNVILSLFRGLLIFIFLMSIPAICQIPFVGESLRDVEVLLFRELGAYGAAMNVGTILGLSLYIITGKKKYIFFAVYFSFAVFLTILKKSIISNFLIWIAFVFMYGSLKTKLKFALFAIVFVVAALSAVGSVLVENVDKNAEAMVDADADEHVRLGMYIASISIASDYFPFGSGMGTFGSLASITKGYSDIHHDYGVSMIGQNSPEAVEAGKHTLLDTYWPHIFAELGVLGTVLFLFIWFFPIKLPLSVIKRCDSPVIKGFCFYIIMIILVMTNEGLTLYTPEIPSFVIFHSGLSGFCYYHILRYKRSPAFNKA